MKHTIAHHRIYKYRIDESKSFSTLVVGQYAAVKGDWVVLREDGMLSFKKGYAYDGPSGPTKDTPDSMAPSLVHDGLYQLMGDSLISVRKNRLLADKTFRNMLKENKMSWFKRQVWYLAVRGLGWLFL